MKKRRYKVLGLIMALTAAFSNIQPVNVSAEEILPVEEELTEEEQTTEEVSELTEEEQITEEVFEQAEEEQGQSWEDANSWRYQNGEQISVQSYSNYSELTTWPDADGVVAKGIDVSYHNGVIDWEKVKADGIDFAIIRCGYGMDEAL